MEEQLQATKQQSDALKVYLDVLHGIWTDTASKETHKRFLDQHHYYDERMLHTFKAQYLLLHESAGWLRMTDEHMVRIRIAHTELVQHLDYTEQQMSKAKDEHATYLQHEANALSQLSTIHKLIDEANRAGQS
jgi:hypothetical protein